jgi:hypothetical protein
MIAASAPGKRETLKLTTLGTSYETLVSAPDKLWTLESILFANTSGSAVTITLEIYNGSTATVLLPGNSLAANDVYLFKDHNITLTVNELLRVKAGTADVIDVTAVGYYGNTTV